MKESDQLWEENLQKDSQLSDVGHINLDKDKVSRATLAQKTRALNPKI